MVLDATANCAGRLRANAYLTGARRFCPLAIPA
jgi:hypothetical protein